MRIVRLTNLYPPYIVGGYEMLTRDVAEELTVRGHDVHVLTARGRQLDGAPKIHQAFNYSLDNKEALFLGGRKLTAVELFRHHVFDLATYRNVRRTVRQLRPDIVVADNLYMASAAPLLAVRDAPCPVVAQVADKWLLFSLVDWSLVVQPRARSKKLAVRAVRQLIQRPLSHFVRLDGIVTVSNFIRGLYIGAGFSPDKLETKYLGVDNRLLLPGPAHPIHDPVRLVFAGGLWEGKGPQVIVRAMRLLSQRSDLPRFQLDLFGEGADGFKEYLRWLIREEGVEEHVSFHGFVALEQLVAAMRAADIFVFSSIWDEPFAITPLLALGCGTPLVATRAGGTPEGFMDGETALLIPINDPLAMADAIARLTQDERLRLKLRESGIRDASERWSFSAYVDRLEEFYRRVIERLGARVGVIG